MVMKESWMTGESQDSVIMKIWGLDCSVSILNSPNLDLILRRLRWQIFRPFMFLSWGMVRICFMFFLLLFVPGWLLWVFLILGSELSLSCLSVCLIILWLGSEWRVGRSGYSGWDTGMPLLWLREFSDSGVVSLLLSRERVGKVVDRKVEWIGMGVWVGICWIERLDLGSGNQVDDTSMFFLSGVNGGLGCGLICEEMEGHVLTER